MKKEEIRYSNTTPEEYDKIVAKAVNYAIVSLPFTINRMKISNPTERVLNTAKGKIAEGLFMHYCESIGLLVDFDTCETPFWQIDNRDFMYDGYEWDLKNNYIYCSNRCEQEQIMNLPALIPNRKSKDQWSTRNEKKIPNSKGVKYLFSFMQGANLIHGKRDTYFIEILLSIRQKKILQKLYDKYKGLPTDTEPYSDIRFWNYFLKDNKTLYKLHKRPKLILTGVADAENWNIFKDTGPYSTNNYIDYKTPYWYKKIGVKNSLMWGNGTIWGTITNKTTPVELLKPFRIK